MRRKLSAIPMIAVLIASLSLGGCNVYADSLNSINVLGGIVKIAQQDVASLQASGVFTAAEAVIVNGYLGGVSTLQVQAATCVASAHVAGNVTSAFLACFNAFAAGLVTPAELAQLHILSAKAQVQVQLWVTALSLAVNAAIGIAKGIAAQTPQIAAEPTPRADLVALARRLNVSPAYGY